MSTDSISSTGEPPIQEAEIIEEETSAQTPLVNGASVFLELEQLIKSNIGSLETLINELKQQKQIFEDGFANDSTFREHAEEAKKSAKQKSATRQEIMKRPGVFAIGEKIKSLSAEVKERKLALSDYLLEYQRIAGANQIEGPDGQEFEIVNKAHLIKRFQKEN